MAIEMIDVNKTSHAEYIADTVADLDKVSGSEFFGCIAYVLATKKFYIMNSQGQWEEQ